MAVTATNLLLVTSAAHTTQYASASTACVVAQWLDISVNVTAYAGTPTSTDPMSRPVIVNVSYFRVEADAVQNQLVSFPVSSTDGTAGKAFHTLGVGSEYNVNIGMNFVLKVDLAPGITSATYSVSVNGKGSS